MRCGLRVRRNHPCLMPHSYRSIASLAPKFVDGVSLVAGPGAPSGGDTPFGSSFKDRLRLSLSNLQPQV